MFRQLWLGLLVSCSSLTLGCVLLLGDGDANSGETTGGDGDGDGDSGGDGDGDSGGDGDGDPAGDGDGDTSGDGDGDGDGDTSGDGDGDTSGDGDGDPGDPWNSATRLTYYGDGNGGACGYGTVANQPPHDGNIVAVPGPVFGAGVWCGAFLEIDTSEAGPFNPDNVDCMVNDATVTVMVVDACPECSPIDWHFDLSTSAMEVLTPAPGTCGVLTGANWRVIEGIHEGEAELEVIDGSSAFFMSVRPRKHNYAVVSVQLRSADSDEWLQSEQMPGNQWVVQGEGTPLVLPLSVRLTDVHGQILESYDDSISAFDPGFYGLGFQFPAGQGGGPLPGL